MTVEIRATIPTSAPTRRMPQHPMPMPQLSSSIVFIPEEGLPQGIRSTAMAVFFSCMLKKLRKRQTSCWVCFLLIQVLARVLFDSGASHSFVTEEFACTSKIQPTKLKHVMIVQIPGSTTKARQICKVVPIRIHGIDFYANLIVLGTKGLEVVLGMDWMSKHKGIIDS